MGSILLTTAFLLGGGTGPAESDHWAFVPPTRPVVPAVKNAAWAKGPIDAFILARLEQEGLTPSARAPHATLIRRVSLDLIGLPPSPEEVDAFVHDPAPDAYEKLVDRLLASPHYGERWTRPWLDLARYADSNGYSIDAPREIWKYRDWVIDAFNRNLPFDQFTIEQLAGDLLPQATAQQRIATGFHRNTPINEEGGIDHEQFRVEAVADRAATTGQVFLGLTLGCCRCHDHKYDPLSMKDFYQLFAFFNNCDDVTLELATPEQSARRKAIRDRLIQLEEEIKKDERRILDAIPDAERENYRDLLVIYNLGTEQRSETQKQTMFRFLGQREPALRAKLTERARLKREEPRIITTMVLAERRQPRETYVQLAGDFTRKGGKVSPDVPKVLRSTFPTPTRLELARWLVDRRNPLTARVTVNRIWQHYFGKGIVETENDFGVQGSPPTHPELLDWLAIQFMESGWDLKRLHRLIVTSSTYRQSSSIADCGLRIADSKNSNPPSAIRDPQSKDPQNRLLWRQNRLRLDAEVIRDSGLTASGLLTRAIGGPSVHPPQPDGVFRFTQVNRDWSADTGNDRYRRGVYTWFWRASPYPALLVFDAPDGTACCTRRLRSNTPLQALTQLNDQVTMELAAGLAHRVLVESHDGSARLERAFAICLNRVPTSTEVARLKQYLALELAEYRDDPEAARRLTGSAKETDRARVAAWIAVSRVLLNLDEFITRE